MGGRHATGSKDGQEVKRWGGEEQEMENIRQNYVINNSKRKR